MVQLYKDSLVRYNLVVAQQFHLRRVAQLKHNGAELEGRITMVYTVLKLHKSTKYDVKPHATNQLS